MFTENINAGKQTYLYYILYYIPRLRNKEKHFVIPPVRRQYGWQYDDDGNDANGF